MTVYCRNGLDGFQTGGAAPHPFHMLRAENGTFLSVSIRDQR